MWRAPWGGNAFSLALATPDSKGKIFQRQFRCAEILPSYLPDSPANRFFSWVNDRRIDHNYLKLLQNMKAYNFKTWVTSEVGERTVTESHRSRLASKEAFSCGISVTVIEVSAWTLTPLWRCGNCKWHCLLQPARLYSLTSLFRAVAVQQLLPLASPSTRSLSAVQALQSVSCSSREENWVTGWPK